MKTVQCERDQRSSSKHLRKLLIARKIKIGIELLSFRGGLLWNNLNDEVKELPTAASFKRRSNTWMGEGVFLIPTGSKRAFPWLV